MSVNKTILLGNLGKDPEVRTLENGNKVANFSIATSETYKDKNTGEKVTNTEWHKVVLWKHLADIAERFLVKGSQVYIEGKLQNRTYDDKDGNTRIVTEVVGKELKLLGGNQSNKPSNDTGSDDPENDLPF